MHTIRKPDVDHREYRYIELPNGIKAVLIHDAETDKSAAAIDVNVGYFSDPKDTQGLAHFCEHMLFLGTKKYPSEKEYNDFLAAHSGMSNAYTDSENTNYFFDVVHTEFEPALDRFAQFFISPLFTQSATDREMKAIDSEHNKNLQSDTWRSFQLLKSTSSPSHPYSKFGTGSLETLKKHEDIQAQLLNFHKQYYSSNIMKLVVLGRESLDKLEEYVREKFTAVENKQTGVPKFPGNPLSKEHVGILQREVPVKDAKKLTLIWPIPSQRPHWRSKPAHVVSHLIGHEGEGSILALLKEKGWVNELVSGSWIEASDFSLFGVQMRLSAEGMEHVEEIISIIFQYIKLLKTQGISEAVYKELKLIDDVGFRFRDTMAPIDFVTTVASSMQLYPPEETLSGSALMYEWRPELVKEVVDALTPHNFRYTVSGKDFEGKTALTEKWYNINYDQAAIAPAFVESLVDPAISAGLHLPPPNVFLPDDFTRRAPPKPTDGNSSSNSGNSSSLSKSGYPKFPKSVKKPQSTLWYKYDDTFNVPKAHQLIEFLSPVVYSSPRAVVLTKIFTKLVEDELNKFSYDATVAGLKYQIFNHVEGFTLCVEGYNCKQQVLVTKILETIAKFKVNSERFEIIKESVQEDYTNFWVEQQPYQRAMYQTSLCMEIPRFSNEEYHQVCPSVTAQELQTFIGDMLKELYYVVFIVGNVSLTESEQWVGALTSVLNAKPLPANHFTRREYVRLEEGKEYIHRIKGFNPEDNNSAVSVYFQIAEESNKDILARLELLAQCTTSSSFNQLRTVEQLGYIVWSGNVATFGISGFRVIVQSHTHGAAHLEERVDAWVESLATELENLSDEDFKKFRDSLVLAKLEKDKSLSEEYYRFKAEIEFPRSADFARVERESEAISKLEKVHVIEFYKNYIAKGGKNRRKFSVLVYGKDHEIGARPASCSTEVVDVSNFREFSSKMKRYPPLFEWEKELAKQQ